VSKYQFQQSSIYQPGTDLPINRLNISDADILHEIEAQLLQQAHLTFDHAPLRLFSSSFIVK
jgi:hypothetical protein